MQFVLFKMTLFDFKKYIVGHWALLTASALAVSGLIALLKNLFHIRNLQLQNEKLKKESRRDATKITLSKDELPRYEEALSGLEIIYTDVARNSLSLIPLSENKFLDLLSIELKSHPLFSKVDYESLPLPLKGGYFAVLTKTHTKLTLETISKKSVKKELFEAWSEMSRLYFKAYRLPFRSDHSILYRHSEFERSIRLLNQLIISAQKYMFATKLIDDRNVRLACHDLKAQASAASINAEFTYSKFKDSNDSSLLGHVAIQLDLIVSAIHKILVEYNVPK